MPDLHTLLWLKSIGIKEIIMPDSIKTKEQMLSELHKKVLNCQKCPLYQKKTNYVFGAGNPYTSLMMVGEAPGYEEDLKGKPFVGRAGELLNRVIKELGYNREQDFYIANVLKCRPPKNRDPLPEEIAACTPYLEKQIRIIEPAVLVALGRYSGGFLLGSKFKMYSVRGRILTSRYGIPLVITYHPAAVLRRPNLAEELKKDLKLAISLIAEGDKTT